MRIITGQFSVNAGTQAIDILPFSTDYQVYVKSHNGANVEVTYNTLNQNYECVSSDNNDNGTYEYLAYLP